MSDNSSEIPENPDSINPQEQNPIGGMFDSWNENSSGPRDIQAEVRQEMQKDSLDMKEPETQEEAVIRLAKGFDAQLMQYRTEFIETQGKKEGWDEEKISEEISNPDRRYISLIGDRDSYMLHHRNYETVEGPRLGEYKAEKLDLESEVIDLTERGIVDPNSIQNIKTHIGIVPAMFVGSDGQVYQAGCGYSLNPTTGEITKGGTITQIPDFESGVVDIDSLKRVPYQSDYGVYDDNRMDYFEDPIEPEDFEKLEEILSRMKSGEIKIDPSANFIY